jgi:polyphenol oxidase
MLSNVSAIGETQWIMPRLPASVRGFFSCRQGGVSRAPYASLNAGLHVGDDAEDVVHNRDLCAKVIGGTIEDWVVAEQVHGSAVGLVTKEHRGMGVRRHDEAYRGVDALITNEPDLTLVVLAADCVPILFVDPVVRAIGVAHSGWKGTVAHIARNVVEHMKMHFGSNPANLHVVLGPSIRSCCYEVDSRVADAVVEEFSPRFVRKRFGRDGKFMLSLQHCIMEDLARSGVPLGQVQDVGLCTSCRWNLFYSHRREHGHTGRHLGAIRITNTTV